MSAPFAVSGPLFAVGYRIAFARNFLRATAQFTGPDAPTHRGPFARGEVVEIGGRFGGGVILRIRWDDGDLGIVLSVNLVRADRLHLEG